MLIKKLGPKVVMAVFLSGLFGAHNAYAVPEATALFIIEQMNTAWSSGVVHLKPLAPHTFKNPGGCAFTDYYALDPNVTGHKERLSLMMSAFLNNKTAKVTVEGCASSSRPQIISVEINR